jgi:hypothetical protein
LQVQALKTMTLMSKAQVVLRLLPQSIPTQLTEVSSALHGTGGSLSSLALRQSQLGLSLRSVAETMKLSSTKQKHKSLLTGAFILGKVVYFYQSEQKTKIKKTLSI